MYKTEQPNIPSGCNSPRCTDEGANDHRTSSGPGFDSCGAAMPDSAGLSAPAKHADLDAILYNTRVARRMECDPDSGLVSIFVEPHN